MDYSKYLKNIKSASKNDLKKLVFTLDNEQVKKIKSMNLNEADEARLISMSTRWLKDALRSAMASTNDVSPYTSITCSTVHISPISSNVSMKIKASAFVIIVTSLWFVLSV